MNCGSGLLDQLKSCGGQRLLEDGEDSTRVASGGDVLMSLAESAWCSIENAKGAWRRERGKDEGAAQLEKI